MPTYQAVFWLSIYNTNTNSTASLHPKSQVDDSVARKATQNELFIYFSVFICSLKFPPLPDNVLSSFETRHTNLRLRERHNHKLLGRTDTDLRHSYITIL